MSNKELGRRKKRLAGKKAGCVADPAGAENPIFRVARDRNLKTMRINSCDQAIREKDPMNPGGVESFFGKQFPSASSVAVETAPQYLKVLRTGHIRTPPGVSMH
jgi:hypothetical protein